MNCDMQYPATAIQMAVLELPRGRNLPADRATPPQATLPTTCLKNVNIPPKLTQNNLPHYNM